MVGEFLKATEKYKGGGDGNNHHKRATANKWNRLLILLPPAPNGITKKESSTAQALVEICQRAPENMRRRRTGVLTFRPTMKRL
jgi:hypothetical protein